MHMRSDMMMKHKKDQKSKKAKSNVNMWYDQLKPNHAKYGQHNRERWKT